MKKRIIVTGATSSISREIIKQFAANGYDFVLLGKDAEEMNKIVSDIKIRYNADSDVHEFDAGDINQHDVLFNKIRRKNKNVIGMIVAHGYISEHDDIEATNEEIDKIIDINYKSIISLTKSFASNFPQKNNFIAVITSVAGERGKKRNLIYSSAKGATSIYLEGLRQELPDFSIIDIKPGFVDTPMTYGILDSPLITSRVKVAKDIFNGIIKRKRVIYTPFYWRYVAFILRHIPGKIYDRLRL